MPSFYPAISLKVSLSVISCPISFLLVSFCLMYVFPPIYFQPFFDCFRYTCCKSSIASWFLSSLCDHLLKLVHLVFLHLVLFFHIFGFISTSYFVSIYCLLFHRYFFPSTFMPSVEMMSFLNSSLPPAFFFNLFAWQLNILVLVCQ